MRCFTHWLLGLMLAGLVQLHAESGGNFPLALAIMQYRYDSARTRVEFAYSIPDTHLVFERSAGRLLRAALDLHITVVGQRFSDSVSVLLESIKPDSAFAPATMVGKRTLLLPPGEYAVTVTICDALRQRSATLKRTFPLNVRAFPRTGVSCGSLELAYSIVRRDTADPAQVNPAFVKGSFYVVPNPTLVYEGTAPLLAVYTELYNLNALGKDSVDLHYHILDAATNEVFDLRYRRPVLGDAQTEVMSVSLDGVPTGVYSVALALEQERGQELQLARQQFYLVNPELPPQQPTALSEDELFLMSPFATMDEQQLAVEVASARFIAGSNELDGFDQLTTLQAKRRFMFRFWLQRDPDPTTPVNERYEEFRKAREYAAKFYRTPRFPQGWNSDRGRVLLKYGFPTQIDRYYFNMDGAHPHEIWRYDNVQGGVIFVFVDQQGTENFVLVHSTALNEIHNENWYRQFAMPNYLDPNGQIR